MVDLILKKKKGETLSKEEINSIISGYTSGMIPDYQVAAWLMAVCFRGLNDEETTYLTEAMMYSGEVIDLTTIPGIKVDKHSTGGVGDKTTLILGPLVAAVGIPVAKMSGRGLGHTGGTLDKLESVPGLQVVFEGHSFIDQVKKIGLAVCAQNEHLVPADKKLYALRDVTGTVDNISLIASSIMSKKLASGADAIVIDIKLGEGAFMKTLEDAEKLASIMINTANKMGRKLIAVVTGMDQPLGNAVGNALEVREAMDTLQGKGPKDLTEVCLELASHMLVLGQKAASTAEARTLLQEVLDNGLAYQKFEKFIAAQGGNLAEFANKYDKPTAFTFPLVATQSGFISEVFALEVGRASMFLGAGRETKESSIDYAAGIILSKKRGDYVLKGDTLAYLHTNQKESINKTLEELTKAYVFQDEKPEDSPLILKTIV